MASRVDNRRIVSAIVFVIKNWLRWRDARHDYGPRKTIYNRFLRRSRSGAFNKIFVELARKGGKPGRVLIDATRLKTHRTAANRLKKSLFPVVTHDALPCSPTYRAHQRRPELQAARRFATVAAARSSCS
jgi:transposase